MANKRGKTVDTTFLSLDTAEKRGFLHRDYIAHCLRWSHIMRRLSEGKAYAEATILDVGCGRELPMAKTLYSSRYIPKRYIGIDVGPILDEAIQVFHSGKFPLEVYEKTDICEATDEFANQVDIIVCLEVLEHVEPSHMLRMLDSFREMLKKGGRAFISTPCWDVKTCADNHVNEMRHDTLGAVFEREGWMIEAVHGTFASIKDYKDEFTPAQLEIFERLRGYYDTNYLATIFAPMFPRQSRNCIWEIVDSGKNPELVESYECRYPDLSEVAEPWGSSENWKELAR
jgi:SAM-dependent methyltransferase